MDHAVGGRLFEILRILRALADQQSTFGVEADGRRLIDRWLLRENRNVETLGNDREIGGCRRCLGAASLDTGRNFQEILTPEQHKILEASGWNPHTMAR